MVLYNENIGAVYFANNWSAGGRKICTETKILFLCNLKEADIPEILWLRGGKNPVDMFTHNLAGQGLN